MRRRLGGCCLFGLLAVIVLVAGALGSLLIPPGPRTLLTVTLLALLAVHLVTIRL